MRARPPARPPAGTLFHYLVAKDEALEAYRRQMARVSEFMNDRDLPNHLRNRVFQYLQLTYEKSKESYGSDIDLPRSMALRIVNCQYRAIVDTCAVIGAPLRGCNEQFMSHLLLVLREVRA